MSGRISSPRLVGRAAELARLAAALADAAGGQPRCVLLGGEAGIGKTRLLAEFTTHAHAQDARVLSGACLQVGEGTLPFAPVAQALRQLVRQLDPATLETVTGAGRAELARLVPDLGPAEAAAPAAGELARARLFERLLGVLERLAAERPLVLAVEDLHWADRSTLDLLGFLVPNLGEAAVVLLASYRTDELDRRQPLRPWLAELGRHASVERLELGRLDREELAVLLAGILGAAPAAGLVDEVLARSQGNPFFAEELLAAGPAGDPGVLPAAVADVLAARIEALSGPALQALRVAAVAGRRVGHGLLATACGLDHAELPSAARARVLARQAQAPYMCSRVRAARASAEEALAVARLVGARQEEGWALLALGTAVQPLGERDAGLAHLREARRIAEEVGEVELLAVTFGDLSQALDAAGRLADALAEVVEGIETGRRLGLERFHGAILGGAAAWFCFRLGRWHDADRYGRTAMAANPMPTMPAIAARLGQAQLEIERGEFAAAAARLDEVTRAVSTPPRPQFSEHFAARAALAIWQDRLDDARAAVREGLDWLTGTEEEEHFRPLLTLGLRAEADRAERARARRTPAEAETAQQLGAGLLARLWQLVDQAAAPQPETLAHAALGEAEATRLHGHSDPERWAAVAASWDWLAQPYPAAYARWRQAEALLTRHGSRAAATTALRSAYQTLERLGATPCAARSRAWPGAPASTWPSRPPPRPYPRRLTRTGSPHANVRSWRRSPKVAATPRSPRHYSSAPRLSASTSPTFSPSLAWPAAARPPRSPTAASWTRTDHHPGKHDARVTSLG